MPRKKKAQAEAEHIPGTVLVNEGVAEVQYIGGDDFNIDEQSYPADSSHDMQETMPPDTKEEAELRQEALASQKVVEEDKGDEVVTEEEEEEDEVVAEEEEKDEVVAEEEEEDEVVAEEEDEVVAKDDDPKIPHARFEEVNRKRKAAEDRIKELEAEKEARVAAEEEAAKVPAVDLDEKEKQYMDFVLEGETDKALAVRKEIRAEEQRLARSEATSVASEKLTVNKEQAAFDAMAASMVAEYPVLDDAMPEYDSDLASEVIDLYKGFSGTGKYTHAGALEKATKTMMASRGLTALSATPAAGSNKANKKASTAAAKVRAKGQQPPKLGESTGVDENATDINSMSEEEFGTLPESTKRRMRGDFA